MKALEEQTLEEILLLQDKKLEQEYYALLESLKTSRISKDIVASYEGESIDYIWKRVVEAEHNYESNIIFPGDLVVLYPNIKEQRTRSFITCDFSGGIIYPGSLYLNYRPLLNNISQNISYVLKRTIKVEAGYYYDLPTTVSEFESLQQKMQMELDHDETGIQYSHFNQRMGGELILQKLKRSKIK